MRLHPLGVGEAGSVVTDLGEHPGAAVFSSVYEVIRVAAEEGIKAEIQKDGPLHVATNAAQERRLRERLPMLRAEGWGTDDPIELDGDQLADRVRVADARGAHWSPHCARIHRPSW
ncbi:hypothetical protein ACWEKM_39705 [Streptomyces sp. NPDC004752]